MNDGWSRSVDQKLGESGTFLTGYGNRQAILAGFLAPLCANGQHQAMQGGQRMLYPGAQDGLTKQSHQVVGKHGKVQRCFDGPEVPHAECVQTEIGLEFIDPVLAAGSSQMDKLYS